MKFFLVFLMLGLGWAGMAAAEVTMDFGAYARSNFQVGKGGAKGETLFPDGGFAKHNRLQEGQYFELGSTAHLPESSRFVVTLANGGDTFHYNGQWPGPGFAVRNLYFAMEKLPDAPTTSAWFGSRMYRGHDIYLFDTWPVDNQNILGGGVAFGQDKDVEFAIGARADAAYTVAAGAPAGTTFSAPRGQRYLLINKLLLPVSADKNLKSNIELQYIPKTTGTLTVGTTATSLEAPSAFGAMAALEYEIWGTNSAFLRYGTGDVSSDVLATTAVATADNPNVATKKGSNALGLGVSNGIEVPAANMGMLYAAIYEWRKPRDGDAASSLSTALRPMHYFTANFHCGFELDWVHYFARLSETSDIDYFQVSPMAEYALNKNVYGSPKFRLIASEAFYARNVQKYGESVKNAYNVGLGFEVWF